MNHLKRKTPCEALYSNVTLVQLLQEINSEIQQQQDDKPLACPLCFIKFSYQPALSRHLHKKHQTSASEASQQVNTTTMSNNNDGDHNAIAASCNTMSHSQIMNENVNNTTNTNSHNSISIETLNVSVVPFGEHDISFLQEDREFLQRCLNQAVVNAIPKIIERIHLNDEKPENKNVKLKRIKRPATMLVSTRMHNDDIKWIETDLDDTILSLVKEGVHVLMTFGDGEYYDVEIVDREAQSEYDYKKIELYDLKTKKHGTFGPTKDKIITLFKREREKEREDAIAQTEGTSQSCS